MKLYKILWSGKTFGESVVKASSKKEARLLAKNGKDTDFERCEDQPDWEIEEITEID